MMLTKDKLQEATPYIRRAHRCLEMIEWFANAKKISAKKHIPVYFDGLIEAVIQLQRILVEDNEYTESVQKAIAEVSKSREYSDNVTQNTKGDLLYVIDAMLPLKEMKRNIVFTRRQHHDN